MRRTRGVGWENGDVSGLLLDVDGRARSDLMVQVAAGGRLLIRQDGRVVLLAKVHQDHSGVEYLITNSFRSLAPPMRTAHAEAIANASHGGWSDRWAHHFASILESSDCGPLYDGRWLLSPHATHLEHTPWARSAARRWEELLLVENPGEIDWFARQGGWQVLPLRPLSDISDGRVKVYRKQARVGVLPPVLLWWISGLDCYVILDGHDRILAAIAEGLEPPFMTLSSVDPHRVETGTRIVVDQFVGQQQLIQPIGDQAVATSGQHLARVLTEIHTHYYRTRAWLLPGGQAAWDAAAQASAPGWFERIRLLTETEP